jgi:glyoxylase-like metal-dependent hydrolase (beta-lactamase superfamily II)
VESIPGVFAINLGPVYAFLIQEADRLSLIDAGLSTSAESILNEIDGLGRKPGDLRQIIVTHYHRDHTGCAAQLVERTNAQVLAHELDAPVVRGDAQEAEPMLSEAEREVFDRITSAVPSLATVAVDRELRDGDEVDLDGGAKIVHVPGHTRGSIAIHLPKKRALFVGDAAARMPDGRLIAGVFNADPDQTRGSFRRLAELDFESAFFGHGAPMDKDACLAFRKVAEKLGQ